MFSKILLTSYKTRLHYLSKKVWEKKDLCIKCTIFVKTENKLLVLFFCLHEMNCQLMEILIKYKEKYQNGKKIAANTLKLKSNLPDCFYLFSL